MRLSTLRRSRATALPGIISVARVDRRTKSLARRIAPGEIAVVDHVDLDRASAVALAEAGVAAVVNAAPSISGRYPNLGPRHLVEAGITLVDDVGGRLITAVHDGDLIRVDGATVYVDDDVVGEGTVQDRRSVERAMQSARKGIGTQLEAVTADLAEHLRHESPALVEGTGVPMLATPMRARQVLVVTKAFDYRRDLALVKRYIKDVRPVLVGVDAGADALLAAGHRPHIIVCDGEDISDAALRCGAEVVVKAGSDGRVVQGDRIERLGVRQLTFRTASATTDAALLIARANQAALVVTAGMPGSLEELLDTGRAGTASALVTQAALAPRLVDAKAVAELYRNRVHGFLVLLLLLLAIAAVAASIATTPVGQDWADQVRDWLTPAYDSVRSSLS
jgi:uncharacterized membrane-anchored protein